MRCAEPRARFTAISTARRGRSASPRRSRSREYLAKTKTPGTVTVFGAPGEEMMPPNAKTVMHESQGVRRHGRSRPQPFVERDDASRRGLRHVLHEHRRREVHLQRRAGASAHGVERPQRAHGGDSSLQQHRRDAQQHASRGAHPGRDHRGRRGAERRARSHRRPTSTFAIPTRSISRSSRRWSTTPRAPRRSRRARR